MNRIRPDARCRTPDASAAARRTAPGTLVEQPSTLRCFLTHRAPVRSPACRPLPAFPLASGVWRLAALTALVVSAGCAEMRWSKPGADAGKLEADLAQCRGEARLQVARESLPRIPGSSPVLRADATGRPVVAQPGSRGTDSLVLEQDLTGSCMRGKGYALGPVEKP
jgi:hypothetical protein